MMSSSLSEERVLAGWLNRIGNRLLMPPNPVDELLSLLDQVEHVLSGVEQEPSETVQRALLPVINALIAQPLLKHPNEDVKVSVATCISEVTRVTAPDPPYGDEAMKVVFELMVMALGKLSLGSGRCYAKAVSILHNLASFRSCVLMLDHGCDNLIVNMIKLFIGSVRSNHPDYVFSDMETIMTIVIDEREEISLELLILIIKSMKTENQNDLPLRWKLGEKVCKRCATKIQAYLPRAAELMKEDLNSITRVVFPVLSGVSEREHLVVGEHVQDAISFEGGAPSLNQPTRLGDGMTSEKVYNYRNSLSRIEAYPNSLEPIDASRQANLESIPEKRRRKPNSLFKPEEGYNHPWLNGEIKEMCPCSATGSRKRAKCQSGATSKAKQKRRHIVPKETVFREPIDEELVDCMILVWWPLDSTYYQGMVHSFDPTERKHLVVYDDGEEEVLDLSNERWVLVLGNKLYEHLPEDAETKS